MSPSVRETIHGWTRCPSVHPCLRFADLRFHHELALEVADLVAVQRLALLDAWDGLSALQLVGLSFPAHAVDEESKLLHVLQTPRHNHLLMDQVGLGQIGASLEVDQKLQEVFGGHDDGGVEGDYVTLVQAEVQVGRESLVEVMNDVGRVAVGELRHRNVDELHFLLLQHADPLLNMAELGW